MASGAEEDSIDDLISRVRSRWTEDSKVYTRRKHKKAQKTSNNNEAATSTTTTVEKPVGPGAASTPTATPPPTSPHGHAGTTTHLGNVGDDVVHESLKAQVAEGADSCQQRLRDQAPHPEQSPQSSADKNVGHSLQQLQQRLSEDNCSTQHQLQVDGASQNAEPQNLRTSNEVPQTNGDGRQSSHLSVATDLINGGEVAAAHSPIQNDGERIPVQPQVSSRSEPVNVNGVVAPIVISRVNDRVRLKLARTTPKNEVMELSEKLKFELDQVRRLVKQLEAKELQLASYNTRIRNSNPSDSNNYVCTEGGNVGVYSHPQHQHARSDLVESGAFTRVNAEVDMAERQEIRPIVLSRVNSDMGTARNLEPRPYSRQLSVAVMENKYGNGEFVEKEKRTPKANKLYRNSEFLLGKDRLPPENVKRLKTSSGRKHSGDTGNAFGFGFDKSRNQAFKSCSSLLQRLMKHKHGWVFNEPVNAKALGLVDYHDIIKHPMDLGTIKTRLSQNWYKSPRDFAEDVRLVFRNAMTYNPKGQDVHIMAEQLSQIFEERWAIIESEYNPYWKYQMYPDSGLLTPPSRRAAPQAHYARASLPVSAPGPLHGFRPAAPQAPALYVPAGPQMRSSDRPEMIPTPVAVDPKVQRPHFGRTPVPRKPKAKDPNKRDMTYEEKQRLSTNLQNLPPEKLEAIVQIMKRRSNALSQHDDEIEVDIDNVDTETLWELDRFVANYKKSLSKYKRKAELALQARSAANHTAAPTNTIPAVPETRIGSETALKESTATPPVEHDKQGLNGNQSSSSSSSSSDSGSSSSDSDSDSSSEDGSDAGHSPGT